MHSNDTVPAGLAFIIFAILGVMIIGSLVFTGWSVLQFRNTSEGTVLAMGKNIEFVEADEYSVQFEYNDYAAPSAPTIEVMGHYVMDFEPETIDKVTFVPVRGVFAAMGYIESWDEETGVAMFTSGRNTVVITMDEYTFTVNGETQTLATPARHVNETAMFPLAPVVESLGYVFYVHEDCGTIAVFNAPAEPPPQEPVETPQPTRPRTAAPTPTPTPVIISCQTCAGVGRVTCSGCNGVGGGRNMLLTPNIPHEIADTGLQWWCTVCSAQTTVTCRTCNGSGSVIVPAE